jgi:hypothetical protein
MAVEGRAPLRALSGEGPPPTEKVERERIGGRDPSAARARGALLQEMIDEANERARPCDRQPQRSRSAALVVEGARAGECYMPASERAEFVGEVVARWGDDDGRAKDFRGEWERRAVPTPLSESFGTRQGDTDTARDKPVADPLERGDQRRFARYEEHIDHREGRAEGAYHGREGRGAQGERPPPQVRLEVESKGRVSDSAKQAL